MWRVTCQMTCDLVLWKRFKHFETNDGRHVYEVSRRQVEGQRPRWWSDLTCRVTKLMTENTCESQHFLCSCGRASRRRRAVTIRVTFDSSGIFFFKLYLIVHTHTVVAGMFAFFFAKKLAEKKHEWNDDVFEDIRNKNPLECTIYSPWANGR